MAITAIVIGSGCAGLVVALNLLDRGAGSVIIVEKEHKLGGNSMKASSGINGFHNNNNEDGGRADSFDLFRQDTLQSAGQAAQPDLIDTLVTNSPDALDWLKTRLDVDLSQIAQLGGHSVPRTHRPTNLPVGAEIMTKLQAAVKQFAESGRLKILVDSKVTKLLTSDDGDENGGGVVGVEYESKESKERHELFSKHVVLATGGFAADRSTDSLLARHRSELLHFPSTAGAFSNGDGIRLAQEQNAGTIDMDKVQIHPTGFVDPKDPENPSKFLCPEVLRGVGGILINKEGQRFCNEMGRRDYVTEKMLALSSDDETQQCKTLLPHVYIVLSSKAAAAAKKHVEFYVFKGFLKKVEGVRALSVEMGLPVQTVKATLKKYQREAATGTDEYGKKHFLNVPTVPDANAAADEDDPSEFYIGTVTPVLHYCMGGLSIDTEGHVLDKDGAVIPGLHACGEVAGGVHGDNRLGGNSLLECVVFGRIVSQSIAVSKE